MQFIGWHLIFTATGLMLRPLSVGLKGSHVPADYFSLEVFVNPLNTAVVSGALWRGWRWNGVKQSFGARGQEPPVVTGTESLLAPEPSLCRHANPSAIPSAGLQNLGCCLVQLARIVITLNQARQRAGSLLQGATRAVSK